MRLTKHPITLAVASAIALATGAAAAAGPAQQAPTLHAPADVDGGARIIVKYRAGTAEEVAEAVRWLLQDATYLTGEILRLDGGRNALG